jgi:hypothetical protein
MYMKAPLSNANEFVYVDKFQIRRSRPFTGKLYISETDYAVVRLIMLGGR